VGLDLDVEEAQKNMITPRTKNPATPDVTETPITAPALRPLLVAVGVDDAA
jgi:hypothetical protein